MDKSDSKEFVLSLQKDLYEACIRRALRFGFSNPSDYIIFVLKALTKEDESLTPEDEKSVSDRLRNLGYL